MSLRGFCSKCLVSSHIGLLLPFWGVFLPPVLYSHMAKPICCLAALDAPMYLAVNGPFLHDMRMASLRLKRLT